MQTTDNEPRSLESYAESLLMPSTPEAPEKDQETAQDEQTPEEPVEDEQTEGEEAEAEDAEDGEADDEQDDEDAEDEGEQQPELITVKVDGRDVQVTMEDLKRSYSGQAYIQKGMQEAAEARKQAEAVFQALNQERAQVAQFVQQMQQEGIPQPPKMPSQELAQKDPVRYNAELGRYMLERDRYEQFQSQTQAYVQQQSEAQRRAMDAHLAEQARILKERVPELADEKRSQEVRAALLKAGSEYGYSEDELRGITDARAVQVLNDARRWRELQQGKATATEKAAKARPVVKPGTRPQNNANQQREKQRQKLKQSGSIDDALGLMFQ